MHWFRRLLLNICLRLLDSGLTLNYKKINERAINDWLVFSFSHPGWRSYMAKEDLKLMKEVMFGKDPDMYHLFIGRRMQLLFMFDYMKKAQQDRSESDRKKEALK